MMEYVKFEGQTHELAAPPGWDQGRLECGALPVAQTKIGGYPAIQSFWKPAPEEMAMLLNGYAVRLTVLSEVMPPVMLEVWHRTPPAGEPAEEAVRFGLPIAQEPKYTVNAQGRIVNRATGVAIPDDEPVMIFRAQDVHARATLRRYGELISNSSVSRDNGRVAMHHKEVSFGRYQAFIEFAEKHPERMKEPDTAP